MQRKIAVLGAGAIGSSIGADLTEAGYDVTIVDQWPAQVETLKADGIARFYRQIIGTPAKVEKGSARVTVGMGQHLVFNETSEPLREYDGHHLQLYIVNFSGPHRQLVERRLVTEESNQHQYRFKYIVDPDSGKVLYTLEHEIRSITHPLYARPLVNRDPAQTNRDYTPGYDSREWAMRAY